jgi:carboxyl-terminal processing protease
MKLTAAQRREVIDRAFRALDSKLAVPEGRIDLQGFRETHEASVLHLAETEDFEACVNAMLKDLKLSHVGFFHEAKPRAAGRIAISATFLKADTADGPRWMFQDVHPGGLADHAGIAPGDYLLQLNSEEVVPPSAPTFALASRCTLKIRARTGDVRTVEIDIPGSRDRKRPLIVPDRVVTARRLDNEIAYVRVSMFPGILGMDVARDLTRAVDDLACHRLIVDLRGNSGGGIGCLRLMSLLCADRRGVGYAVGRKQLQDGTGKEQLPQFDRIPDSKLGVLPLAIRFGLAGRSVAVFTEALGERRHHGRCVILQNEHSASASEMVLAFAEEYRLATLVGSPSPGRLVGASSVKVGYGFRLALPVAAYFTWADRNLEGVGVTPMIDVPIDASALRAGRDDQLDKAIQIVNQL